MGLAPVLLAGDLPHSAAWEPTHHHHHHHHHDKQLQQHQSKIFIDEQDKVNLHDIVLISPDAGGTKR